MHSRIRVALILAGLAVLPSVARAADPEANDELPLEVVRTFAPLKGFIQTAALSPDEKLIAAGARLTDTLFVWEMETGKERTRIKLDHNCYTFNAAFAADGKTIAWEDGGAGVVRVFDTTSGKMVRQFTFLKIPQGAKGSHHHSYGAAFSNSGKLFAFASGFGFNKNVELWDVETGKLVRQFPHNFANSCAISADEKMIATQDSLGEIRVFDIKGKQLHAFRRSPKMEKAQAAYTLIALSPDGKHLAAGGHFDDNVTVWNLETGKKVLELSPGGKDSIPSTAVFTRDGKWVAVGSNVGATAVLQFYDIKSGKKVGVVKSDWPFNETSVRITEKTGYLTSAGRDELRLYGPSKGRETDLPFFVPSKESENPKK